MKLKLVLLSTSLVLALALPATAQETLTAPVPETQGTVQEKETVGSAVVQPLRDLSIIKQKTPELLREAAADPYAPGGTCAVMQEEMVALDKLLGPELGEVNDSKGSLVTDVVKSAVRLPFSGVFRRLTGAHKRDQAYQDAVIAGVARRAYLKGALTACAPPPPLVAETVAPNPTPIAEPAVSVAVAP